MTFAFFFVFLHVCSNTSLAVSFISLQLSMLSDVRSLVAPQDLELYDRLVLHREREAHQAWHGGLGVLHPQSHCNRTAPVIHDAGHTIPATVHHLSTTPENLLKYCLRLPFHLPDLFHFTSLM